MVLTATAAACPRRSARPRCQPSLPARDERAPARTRLLGSLDRARGPTRVAHRGSAGSLGIGCVGARARSRRQGRVGARSPAPRGSARSSSQLGAHRTGAVLVPRLLLRDHRDPRRARWRQVRWPPPGTRKPTGGSSTSWSVRCRGARWLTGRLVVAAAAIVVSSMAAGLLAWFGAALQDSGVSLRLMVEAGANVIAPALLVLGIGTLVHGVWPRVAVIATYVLVAWSFLAELVGAAGEGRPPDPRHVGAPPHPAGPCRARRLDERCDPRRAHARDGGHRGRRVRPPRSPHVT